MPGFVSSSLADGAHANTRVLYDVLVPRALLRAADKFGGATQGDCLRGDLLIDDHKVLGLRRSDPGSTPRMILPAPVEAHCHLDKCHTIDRLGTVGGDLAAAIAAQMKDKARWTAEDLRSRMRKGLAELMASGCRALRSHIDWGDGPMPPVAWEVLHELAADQPELTIQTAALTGIDRMADAAHCEVTARAIAQKPGAVLGAFVLHHDPADIRTGLANVFAAADRYGLPLDFHVDEGLGDWNGLERICDTTLACGFEGPILCGHAVSLADRNSDDFDRIAEKLLRAGISICALPTTNLYLQGRTTGTPDRRGITRLRELRAAGVPVIVASDNVGDAFCPMGQHDPRAALHLAALAAHLDPPMGDWLPAITTDAAKALGLAPGYVDTAGLDDLRLCPVPTTADLVAGRASLTPLPDDNEDIAS